MATYTISDIHGHYDEFRTLLDKLAIDFTKDKLVLLGDYIDRGPQSAAVVREVMRLQREHGSDRVIALRGNHEQMALEDGFGGWDRDLVATDEESEQLLDFFRGLPLYHENEHCVFVHGGIRPGVPMDEQDEEDLLWVRGECYLSRMAFAKTVVFGHTPTCCINGGYEPVLLKNRIAIDTGCAFGGYLTALKLDEDKVMEIVRCPNLTARAA
jgi:serine/threonine protein phosphatase 1